MAFTVITPVDLNQTAKCKEPFKLDLEKTFCCFCCKSGPLSVVVHLPVSGFVSGQIMPITAEVDNASNVTVDALKLCLRKNISFQVQQPRSARKREVEKIDELTMGPIDAGGSRTWEQKIEVPALPPSNLVNCGIIDLDYELFVEAQVGGMHKNLDGVIPITLGTVPLTDWKSPVPYTDKPPVMPETDPSMLPTQPVSPASPPAQGGAVGWGISDENNMYPTIREYFIQTLGDYLTKSESDLQLLQHSLKAHSRPKFWERMIRSTHAQPALRNMLHVTQLTHLCQVHLQLTIN